MKHNRAHSQLKPQLSPLSNQQKWKPYRDIPFTPQSQARPLIQRLNRDMPYVVRNEKVRKFASKQIEGHFSGLHQKYKSKQNLRSHCFRVKAKREDHEKQAEGFWLACLHERQQGIRCLMEEYFREVSQELVRRKEWSETEGLWNKEQKVINQYNIIYEYRGEKLPKWLPK